MNVHFLELFYYVAKHGGISAAVRNIDYGIQQPAVSTQIGKLEKELGVQLFERTPFRLTPAGEILYAHVAPFFDKLPLIATQLRGKVSMQLRIAGAELILRDHVPEALRGVKKLFPGLRYSLRTLGFQSETAAWLRSRQIDVAFMPLNDRAPTGLSQKAMARVPLALQVPRKSKYKTAEEILSQKRITLPLICLAENSNIARTFQRELKRRGIHWPQTIEATSLDLVARNVADGDGIGVGARLKTSPGGVRMLDLDGFPPVVLGAMWYGEPGAATQAIIDAVYEYVKRAWPEAVC